jgi:hypothetical protein
MEMHDTKRAGRPQTWLEIAYGRAPYSVARLAFDDCWVQDIFAEETMNSFTLTGDRNTMQQVVIQHTFPNLGASSPARMCYSTVLFEAVRAAANPTCAGRRECSSIPVRTGSTSDQTGSLGTDLLGNMPAVLDAYPRFLSACGPSRSASCAR